MMTKEEIESNVTDVLNKAESSDNTIQQFTMIWQGTIRPALSLFKLITGKKIDERLDQLVIAADGISDGTGGQRKFCMVYSTLQIRTLLKTIQIFTGPKVDKANNKFIGLADQICNGGDD